MTKNQKIKYLVCLVGSFLLASCSENDISAEVILNQTLKKMENKKLLEYNIDYKIKYFDSDDTITFPRYDVIIKSMPNDTVLGYHAKIFNTQESKVYNGKMFYALYPKAKQAIIDNVSENGGEFTKKNIKKELIFNSAVLKNYFEKASSITLDKDLSTEEEWKLDFVFPTSKEITFLKKEIQISKKSLMPIKIESFARFMDLQDEYIYANLNFSDNSLSKDKLIDDHVDIPDDYEIKYWNPSFTSKRKLLEKNMDINDFQGTDLNNGNNLLISLNSNNLVLLDFWHLRCAPCLNAMPEINEIYEKFKSQGLQVYGINPVDKENDKVINKFINKLNISYKIIKVDKEVETQFNIFSYPALYLIKNNKIMYSKSGFKKGDGLSIEKVIKKYL